MTSWVTSRPGTWAIVFVFIPLAAFLPPLLLFLLWIVTVSVRPGLAAAVPAKDPARPASFPGFIRVPRAPPTF